MAGARKEGPLGSAQRSVLIDFVGKPLRHERNFEFDLPRPTPFLISSSTKMITTLGVIIIAVGSSVTFFIGTALSIILILRANDRKRRNKDDAARQFIAGQRGRLSLGSANYSNVPEPRANLRRSTHLPYGVVSEGWASIPSQETLPRYERALINRLPGSVDEPTRQKRRRSLRASFSAHSFSLPKTRRQKKIEKAVPLRSMPRSPLSAITERSGTATTEASPSVGIAELPTEMTPKSTPRQGRRNVADGKACVCAMAANFCHEGILQQRANHYTGTTQSK